MTANSAEAILESIREAGRRVLPMHEYLAEHHPDGLASYNSFLTSSIYENDSLEPKYKEMVLACICVAVGSSAPVITAHFRKSLAHGANRSELIQAIEMTAAVMATRGMAAGVSALLEADEVSA